MLHNYRTQGAAWRAHGIAADRVRTGNRHIGDGSAALWELVQEMIADAVTQGWLAP